MYPHHDLRRAPVYALCGEGRSSALIANKLPPPLPTPVRASARVPARLVAVWLAQAADAASPLLPGTGFRSSDEVFLLVCWFVGLTPHPTYRG